MNRRLLFSSWALAALAWAIASPAEAGLKRGGCGPVCAAPCAPACDVVYDVREVTCYRTVFETAYREVRCNVCKPVYETATRECRQTVCKFVTDVVERQQCCTVMKPVYQTVQQTRCRLVCEAVTTYCTVRRDCGHWETQAAAGPTCGDCGSCSACCQPCPQRVWVPNIVEQRVPRTRYVTRTVREVVPVQICRYVPETVTRTVKVPVCRVVPEVVVRTVPYVTCKMVTEEVVRKVPYCVCKQVPYTVQVRVPRYVPRPTCTGCASSAPECASAGDSYAGKAAAAPAVVSR